MACSRVGGIVVPLLLGTTWALYYCLANSCQTLTFKGCMKFSLDVAFAIETICHSPDHVKCFSRINHTLKKGGFHFRVIIGSSCPNAVLIGPAPIICASRRELKWGTDCPLWPRPYQSIRQALEAAGFEVLEAWNANRGVHSPHEIPWYETLNGSFLPSVDSE